MTQEKGGEGEGKEGAGAFPSLGFESPAPEGLSPDFRAGGSGKLPEGLSPPHISVARGYLSSYLI